MRNLFTCFEGPAKHAKEAAEKYAGKAKEGLDHAGQRASSFFKPSQPLCTKGRGNVAKGYGSIAQQDVTRDSRVEKLLQIIQHEVDRIRSASAQLNTDDERDELPSAVNHLIAQASFRSAALSALPIFNLCLLVLDEKGDLEALQTARSKAAANLRNYTCDDIPFADKHLPQTASTKMKAYAIFNPLTQHNTALTLVDETIALINTLNAEKGATTRLK